MGYERAIAWLAERVGAEMARQAIVIEDSIAGIQSAKAAGLPCLAVAHSYPETQLVEAGADAVVATIASVDDALLAALHRKLAQKAATEPASSHLPR
jgi:phosphoglycolate phosphatase-like HAD superfamily hydrolase